MKTSVGSHNPDKLTDEQVGVSEGWRLLEADEVTNLGKGTKEIQRWRPYNRWSGAGHLYGSDWDQTYRTKLTKSQLRKCRGLSI